ncbi:MAG: N-acetylmuramoyl-L-alanine amidase [Desulfotomaculaceae bacterium]|nr:N-acetylmuramoyl-L-alanine amidase [Desulfotomaculaceae bacterium]
MYYRKVPRITNLWSKVTDGEKGEWLSKLFIESTRPFEHSLIRVDNEVIIIRCKGVMLNMPEGKISINDGLVREVCLKQDNSDSTSIELFLDQPAEVKLATLEVFPFRLEITLDRSYLARLFSGKTVMIDPAHGGKDTGGQGAVSLMEKDVVMPIAINLQKALQRAGAKAVLTRNGDEDISAKERFEKASLEKADIYISLHTHACADSRVAGAATKYLANSDDSTALATYIQEELVKKIKVADRGVAEELEPVLPVALPAVEVEVVTITNIVEEVFLRGLTIQKRAAEGIFNGLRDYFAVRQSDLKVN